MEEPRANTISVRVQRRHARKQKIHPRSEIVYIVLEHVLRNGYATIESPQPVDVHGSAIAQLVFRISDHDNVGFRSSKTEPSPYKVEPLGDIAIVCSDPLN